MRLVHGDCLDVLRTLPDCTVDAVVTDPPSSIGFMGLKWDSDRGGRDQWIAWLAERLAECYRVLKPGAHIIVWALPKTSGWTHRAIEDAGFEHRHGLAALHGQGFPKNLNVAKAVEDAGGNGADYTGRGTALKPSWEMWCLARKPLDSTVAGTVTRWGTGALNIAATRVGTDAGHFAGRWPADVVLSHSAECNGVCSPGCAVAELDQQSGTAPPSARIARRDYGAGMYGPERRDGDVMGYCDSGGASRFFKIFHTDPDDEFFPIESGVWVQPGGGSTKVESTSAGRTTGSRSDSSPTAGSGNRSTGQSPPDMRSTTSTTTHSTTTSTTSPASPPSGMTTTTSVSAKSTGGSTELSIATAPGATSGLSSPVSTCAEPEPGAATASHVPSPSDANGLPTTANGSTPSAGTGTPAACLPDRFFPTFRYQAKPSTREKGQGLDDRNTHPTVKPVELMRWLVRLVTPPGGTVLDCFAGSGSTLVAATLEGFDSVGVEAEAEYLPLIEGRCRWAETQAASVAPTLFGEMSCD